MPFERSNHNISGSFRYTLDKYRSRIDLWPIYVQTQSSINGASAIAHSSELQLLKALKR